MLTRVPTDLLKAPDNSPEGGVLTLRGETVAPEIPGVDISGVTKASSFDPTTGRLLLVNRDGSVVIIDMAAAFRGAQGKQGLRGIPGKQGLPGRNGRDGREGRQGCPGEKGDEGPIGPTGPTGPTGKQGDIGPIGPTGPTGATGNAGQDGEEPEWIDSTRGVAIRLRRAGGTIQSGRFELEEVNRETITLLFPTNFVNNVRSLVLTFIDPYSYQASNYTLGEFVYDDVEIGGITISLKGSIPSPLTDKWDFYWYAMGD